MIRLPTTTHNLLTFNISEISSNNSEKLSLLPDKHLWTFLSLMRNKSKLLKLPSSWYTRNASDWWVLNKNENVPCLRHAHGWYTEYASSSWYDNKTLLAFFPGFDAWAFSVEWQRHNRDVKKQVEYNMVFMGLKCFLRPRIPDCRKLNSCTTQNCWNAAGQSCYLLKNLINKKRFAGKNGFY